METVRSPTLERHAPRIDLGDLARIDADRDNLLSSAVEGRTEGQSDMTAAPHDDDVRQETPCCVD